MNNALLVFLGGGLGSLCRYGISWLVNTKFQPIFPFATLFSNIISCLIVGLVAGLLSTKIGYQPSLRIFLLIGFCGGLSTFSTFSFETLELLKHGNVLFAGLNILISTIVCIGIIYVFIKYVS